MSDSLQPGSGGSTEVQSDQKVAVVVDQKKHLVRPGAWVVADFKQAVKVDAAKALDQLVDGLLQPLADDATIIVKGGEQFVSHARQGGSS